MDFDAVYGVIRRPMFERLILCDFAVADLTTANPNVFCELGVRHAVKPHTSVLLFAEGSRLPFDVAPLRAVPYRLTSAGVPERPEQTSDELARRLVAARSATADSPVYGLVDGYPDIQHLKADPSASESSTPPRGVEAERRLTASGS